MKPLLLKKKYFPYRIESMITPGFPDVIAFKRKKYLFIELKSAEIGKQLRVRESQVAFNRKHPSEVITLIYFSDDEWGVVDMKDLAELDCNSHLFTRYIKRQSAIDISKIYKNIKGAVDDISR